MTNLKSEISDLKLPPPQPSPGVPGEGESAAPARPVITPTFLAFLGLLCLLPALWPGDVPFINDEPNLIAMARQANANHTLAVMGLLGTHGIHYGPLPAWIYQGLLLATGGHLLALVSLRAAIFMLATAAALVDIAKSAGLWKWFVPIILAGPYLWLYGRIPWDNTFCLPLGAILITAHLRLLGKPGPIAAMLWGAAIIGLILTHFMVLPLVLPVLGHIVLFRPKVLRRYAAIFILLVLLGIILPLPYWISLFAQLRAGGIAGCDHGRQGWWFPLLSGRLLGGTGLQLFAGQGWARHIHPIVPIIASVSAAMFALVWLGIIRALATPKTAISLLCLTGFALQIILHGLLHVYGLPHYYCGTWIITVLLAWLGADALSRHIAGRALVIAAGSSAAIVTCVLAIFLHLHAGSRTLGYGPNLAEQLNIARQMNRLAPADVPVQSDVETIQQFPQALQLLRQMDRTVRAGQNDVGGFRVDYRDDDPFDAHLRLEVVSLVTHQ